MKAFGQLWRDIKGANVMRDNADYGKGDKTLKRWKERRERAIFRGKYDGNKLMEKTVEIAH